MHQESLHSKNANFGFITIIQVPDLGHCGGLLVLNMLGRPTEFHCTAPVPENRAQRILYGKTYERFLYCDQIGLALVGKIKKRPDVIITNLVKLLPLGEIIDSPVLLAARKDTTDLKAQSIDPELNPFQLNHFEIHDHQVWMQNQPEFVFNQLRQLCIKFTESIPIDEPFERIVQAIEEAQAVVR